MPAAQIKALAEKSGQTVKTVEGYWEEAKKQALKKFNKETDPEAFYAYTTAIVKKRLKLDNMKGKVYKCKACDSVISDSDKHCTNCGSELAPVNDATNLGVVSGISITLEDDKSLVLKSGSDVIRITNSKWAKKLGETIVKAAAKM